MTIDAAELAGLRKRLEQEARNRRLLFYRPYAKQLDFHAAGATHRERLLMAGNRVGKTMAGGMETAAHLTGRYPDNWPGKRFNQSISAWAGGVTALATRDVIQEMLLGPVGEFGTGTIPKDAIVDVVSARGIPGLVDTVTVRHESGRNSQLGLKSYAEGREKWQGTNRDLIWLDEEPEIGLYLEALTRTNTTGGIVFMTFTPLLGVSEVVRRFVHEPNPDRHVTTMTIEEAEHIPAAERAKIIASYPAHEVEARTKGVPVLGSGRIFPVSESAIVIPPRDIPRHWPRIGGLDFGWNHPAAAVECAIDRDTDSFYVLRSFRAKEQTPVTMAAALRPWGKELRWAWPHDGHNETMAGAGIALATQYRDQGLNLLHEHAQFEDGSNSVWAGLQEMLDFMQTGRFHVIEGQLDWLEEFRLYHHKDGKVVKLGDDLMAATRYAFMMRRFAQTVAAYKAFHGKLEYPRAGIA